MGRSCLILECEGTVLLLKIRGNADRYFTFALFVQDGFLNVFQAYI